jgi:hypothetical protein
MVLFFQPATISFSFVYIYIVVVVPVFCAFHFEIDCGSQKKDLQTNPVIIFCFLFSNFVANFKLALRKSGMLWITTFCQLA